MSETICKRWYPLEKIGKKVNLDSISYCDNELILHFSFMHSIREIKVTFKNSVLSYRSETESNFIDTYDFLDETKEKDFYAKWSFFKLENSNYIEWFKQTENSKENIEHYLFLTEDVFEILATSAPTVMWME